MTQATINTAGTTRWGRTLSDHRLFSLNADIPAVDALEHASILQDCANKLTTQAAYDDPTGHAALSAVYLGEMAKAIMDDVAQGIGATT